METRIKWHRPTFDTETGKSIYEDSEGRFEIRYRPDDGSGYGGGWTISRKDGEICWIDTMTYLADAKHYAEQEIREQQAEEEELFARLDDRRPTL